MFAGRTTDVCKPLHLKVEAETLRHVSHARIDQGVMFVGQTVKCFPVHAFRLVARPVQNTWLPAEAITDSVRSPCGAIHDTLALGRICQAAAMAAGKNTAAV